MKDKTNGITLKYVTRIKTLILILLLLPVSIIAYSFDYSYRGVTFRCKITGENSVTVKSWKARNTKEVTVPAIATDRDGKNYNVTSVDVYISGDSYSTERLVLENGISRIEDRCFHEFFKLKRVIIPANITYIGVKAFGNVKSSKLMEMFSECPDSESIIKALSRANYTSEVKSSSDKPRNQTIPQKPIATQERPNAGNPVPIVGTLVVKSKAFYKVENSIEAIRGKMFDYRNKPCALVKITIARYKPSYSSNDIPEPALNYISYNVKGKDHVWMVDGATSLYVYSDNKEFEPATLFFRDISKGTIPSLESGCVYELQLRIEYDQ